jgi:hypothetical protein
MNTDDSVVISDVRFPNEILSIKRVGGIVVRTHRGPDPVWWKDAETINRGPEHNIGWATAVKHMKRHNIHASETAWIGTKFDAELNNDGSIDELYEQIKSSATQGTGAGQWSARKAQLLAKKYKAAGGRYK